MSHTETRTVFTSGEVVLLRGNGRNHKALRKVADEIHARTRALVIVDAYNEVDLSKLDRDEMRRHGWVRVEELDQLRRESAGATS